MPKQKNKYGLKSIHDVDVFLAADAFLYLPIYAAKELNIFQHHNLKVNISTPKNKQGKTGDDVAITELYKKSKGIGFAIASAAPLLSSKTETLKEIDNCRVIGSLISKLSYWALNHSTEEFKTVEGLVSSYKNIIYYNDNFREGHYLGKKLREVKTSLKPILINDFGKELKVLEDNNEDFFTVSACLEKIVAEIEKDNNTVINYEFSKDKKIGANFLTTAIISKKTESRVHEQVAIQFLNAIQKTILILYSSSTAAKHCIVQINSDYNFSLTPSQKDEVMSRLRDEELYKNDLNISLKSWTESMKALELSEWISMRYYNKYKGALKIRRSYKELVDNSIAHKSEKLLAEELGINRHSFVRLTDSYLYRIIHMILGFIKISFTNFYFVIISVIILLISTSIFILNKGIQEWKYGLSIALCMAGFALGIFALREWRNKEKK